MNMATEHSSETNRDVNDQVNTDEEQPVSSYILNSLTWEDEVEKVVVLCNN